MSESEALEDAQPRGQKLGIPGQNSGNIHIYSAVQFALSALAAVLLWSGAALAAFWGVVEFVNGGSAAGQPLLSTLMAGALGSSGLLLLPSAFFALMRLLKRPVSLPESLPSFLRPTILIFIFPLVLLLGYWISLNASISWLALPPLHVLAIGLPVLWLLYLGIRKLPLGSQQRRWGVFGSGLVLGPALILVSELGALLVFGVIGMIAIASQPELVQQLQTLAQHLQFGSVSPDMVMQVLGPYLSRPAVLLTMLSFGAVVVPLIEELFKPIGVWLLIGYDLSPAAGFAAGAMSGAGYGLFESLALTSSGEAWIYLVVARIGTAVIHILTAALMGWALVQAWSEKRYLRLAITYLTAVSIHGLWNALTLISSYSSLASAQGASPVIPWVVQLGDVAPFGLGALTIGAFVLLLWSNQVLRRDDKSGQDGTALDLPAE
jgi:hypothetical protein